MKLILACTLSVTSIAVAQDAPDLGREKRLHQIYQQYNVSPTSESRWQDAMANTTNQAYTIEKGDTLWDVSETFFGEPDFWPKIWSLNRQGIFNPHEIDPGDQIQFQPGTLSEPPSFDVAKGQGGGAPTEAIIEEVEPRDKKHDLDTYSPEEHPTVEIDLAELDIPMPRRRKKTATIPPASFPHYRSRTLQVVRWDIRPIERKAAGYGTDLNYYLTDRPFQPLGTITESESGALYAHERQHVVIQAQGAATGQDYLVSRSLGTLKSRGKKGEVIEIQGRVRIGEVVNAGKNLYRATVTQAFVPIPVGGQLTTGEVLQVSVDRSTQGVDAPASIVGGAFGVNRTMFGPGEILFLEGSGLTQSAALNVYRIERTRNEKTKEEINPRLIGVVQILRVDGPFATAVVTTSTEPIEVGDSTSRLHQPE